MHDTAVDPTGRSDVTILWMIVQDPWSDVRLILGAYLLTKNIRRIFSKTFRRMDQQAENKDKTERVIGLGRRTRRR